MRTRVLMLAAVAAVLAVLSGCATPAPVPPPVPAQVPVPTAAAMTKPDVDAWLDGLVPAALERTGIPGAAVAVVRDGRVLTTRGFGLAATGSGGGPALPVDPDRTLFRVGSVSKVFTATAVLQLVEQGRIDLDADVSRYLDFPLPRRFPGPITMRHLLTHTAGFEERIRGLIQLGPGAPDLRGTLTADPPEQVFAPGTTPAYSNYGYGLAGYVVQRVSGMPFEQYVQRTVLDRAGMTSSTFAQPLPAALAARLAEGHTTADTPALPFELVNPAPAGALTTSASDMARFLLTELDAGPPLLTPPSRDLMRRPGLDTSSLGSLAGGPQMALGLFDESRDGRTIFGHGGDTQFFHAHLQFAPADRTGIVVLLNGAGHAAATDSGELRDAVLHGFTDRYLPAPPAAAVARPDTAHAAMAQGRYAGARASFSTFASVATLLDQLQVTARPDGTVQLDPAPGGGSRVYREIRPWVWQEVGGQSVVTMRASGDRVDGVDVMPAFTMLRVGPAGNAALVVPVLLGSVVILLATLLWWPVGAVARRRRAEPAPVAPGRVDPPARVASRVGAACALLALVGWAGAFVMITGLQDVPVPALAVLTGLQWLGVLAAVPAAAGVVSGIRHRVGAGRLLGRVLLLLALVAVAGVGAAFGLLTPDWSY